MSDRRLYTPHEYQDIALEHLLDRERCALWAGMGMGKTVSTLTALNALQMAGEHEPALVVGPLRVVRGTWPDEVKKWNHLSHIELSPVIGSEAERIAALKRDASVYAVNYDNLPWLVDYLGDRWPFRTVVPDESTRLKGFRGGKRVSKNGREYFQAQGTMRSRSLMRPAWRYVKRWINLTGTPAPNGLKDLWGQTWFLDQGERLGRSYEGFMQRWFQKSHDGYSVIALPFAQEQITDRLRDLCLSLRPEDYFDIQKPLVRDVFVDLPAKAMRQYKDMERDMFLQIGRDGIEAFNAASRTMKCLQLANGAIYPNPDVDGDDHPKAREWREVHDAKLDALESVMNEAAGMPLLVAYQFKSDLARILKAFPKARLIESKQDEDDWNAGKIPLGLGHPKSMGHGLNLQDGSHLACFFGQWWDAELYSQFIERIGPVRQLQSGYNRVVRVYRILARGTVDEDVAFSIDNKLSVEESLKIAMRRVRG